MRSTIRIAQRNLLRKLDHARSEEMFMNLQPAIREGNRRAIEVGIKLLDYMERISDCAAPQRHELTCCCELLISPRISNSPHTRCPG